MKLTTQAKFVEDSVVEGIERFHGNPTAEVFRGERIWSSHVHRFHSIRHHQPKHE